MARLCHVQTAQAPRRRTGRQRARTGIAQTGKNSSREPSRPRRNLTSIGPFDNGQYRIAKAIDVPPRRINEIVHGKRGIRADTALGLSRALGLTDMFFINMQAHHDAAIAREQLAAELAGIDRIA